MDQLLSLTLKEKKNVKIHEESLANACYDIGEFAVNFSEIKSLNSKLKLRSILEKIYKSSKSKIVKTQAINSIQKIMIQGLKRG